MSGQVQSHRPWIACLVCVVIGCVAGCGSAEQEFVDDEPTEYTYICAETKARITGPLQTWPFVNPKTNRRTFSLVMYCSACKTWHALPPPDKARGNPLAYPCPKTGKPLSVTGPETGGPGS